MLGNGRLCKAFAASLALMGLIGVAKVPPHAPSQQATMTMTAPALYTKYSYRGRPDLGLAVAIAQAGNRHGHFDGKTFLRTLAGRNVGSEKAHLERLYGKARVAAFVETLTFSMNDLTQVLRENHITLPSRPRVRPSDGRAMAWAIYHDGIMPNGRYDCGYMMEHLISHPIHVVIMRDVNNQRGHGPRHNANFHIILTRVVVDLKNVYHA
jgi:hypothetical protein